MESLYLLIPISIAVVVVGVLIFFWAVNDGQYDDLDGEAERILFDDVDGSSAPKLKQELVTISQDNISQDQTEPPVNNRTTPNDKLTITFHD
ncbi:MAG: cbb3-type cytochrome oxidase assembly protein CcoS [Porticoccaceae bacterium]|nr:cbb3-type cytochrome oxidase assembly protein CcoS [Porticoccaceae bacterium]